MILNEMADELARICSRDLGREITQGDIQAAFMGGVFPERLTKEEQSDMFCTLVKEMDRMKSEIK